MRSKKSSGQTLTEYLLLICLITVGSIPIIGILSNVLRDQMNSAAHRLADRTADSQSGEILRPAREKVRRNLADFWHR